MTTYPRDLSGLRRKSLGVGHAARRYKTRPLPMITVCGSTGPDTEPEPPQTAIMETVGGYPPSTRPLTPKGIRRGQLRSPSALDHAVRTVILGRVAGRGNTALRTQSSPAETPAIATRGLR